MGLFDSIISSAMKGMLGPAESQALPGALSQILGRTDLGGIGGLLAQLQQGGLDRQVASWLGSGSNMPVNADQLRSALGNDRLQQIGGSAGLSIDQLLGMLTQHLPGAVDRMSPKGVMEEPASDDEPTGSLAEQAGLDDIKP
jgi:uncharacterized protein YidB (DUF937 family)